MTPDTALLERGLQTLIELRDYLKSAGKKAEAQQVRLILHSLRSLKKDLDKV